MATNVIVETDTLQILGVLLVITTGLPEPPPFAVIVNGVSPNCLVVGVEDEKLML